MIRVRRTDKPAILRDKEEVWLSALQNADTSGNRVNALQKYRHKKIQLALKSMFHGKCAYCESKIDHVSFAHIDHYHPKSKFPSLVFEWNNLLLACNRCNSLKADHFPDEIDGGPIVDPTKDNPQDHFYFHYDPISKTASIYGTSERGLTTENLLKLNRIELRRYRSSYIAKLVVIAKLALSNSEAQDILNLAKLDSAEYAAFIRDFSDSAV